MSKHLKMIKTRSATLKKGKKALNKQTPEHEAVTSEGSENSQEETAYEQLYNQVQAKKRKIVEEVNQLKEQTTTNKGKGKRQPAKAQVQKG